MEYDYKSLNRITVFLDDYLKEQARKMATFYDFWHANSPKLKIADKIGGHLKIR